MGQIFVEIKKISNIAGKWADFICKLVLIGLIMGEFLVISGKLVHIRGKRAH